LIGLSELLDACGTSFFSSSVSTLFCFHGLSVLGLVGPVVGSVDGFNQIAPLISSPSGFTCGTHNAPWFTRGFPYGACAPLSFTSLSSDRKLLRILFKSGITTLHGFFIWSASAFAIGWLTIVLFASIH
jgi:hypothetical protein